MIQFFIEPLFVSLGLLGIAFGCTCVFWKKEWCVILFDTFYDLLIRSFLSCFLTAPTYFIVKFLLGSQTLETFFIQLCVLYPMMGLLLLFIMIIHFLYEVRHE